MPKNPIFPVSEEEIAKFIGDPHIALISEGSIAKASYLAKKSKRTIIEDLFRAKTYPEFAQALAKVEEPDEEEDRISHADMIFEEILYHIRAHFPLQLEKSIPLISQSRQAIFHHVKLKTVLENFFLA